MEVIYICFQFYAAVQLINGTKAVSQFTQISRVSCAILSNFQRNHLQIVPFLLIRALNILLSVFGVKTKINELISFYVDAIISIYFFICIYSLYVMFKNEKLGDNGQIPTAPESQYQQIAGNFQQPQSVQQPQFIQKQLVQQPPIFVQPEAPPPTYTQVMQPTEATSIKMP